MVSKPGGGQIRGPKNHRRMHQEVAGVGEECHRFVRLPGSVVVVRVPFLLASKRQKLP